MLWLRGVFPFILNTSQLCVFGLFFFFFVPATHGMIYPWPEHSLVLMHSACWVGGRSIPQLALAWWVREQRPRRGGRWWGPGDPNRSLRWVPFVGLGQIYSGSLPQYVWQGCGDDLIRMGL